MWSLSAPPYEIIIRAFVVYAALFILFRLAGRKQLGEMSPFDFVLLLIISESVSNSLNGDDSSITAGILSASALIFLSFVMDRLAFRSKRLEKWLEGEAHLIIADGKIRKELMNKEKITEEELNEAIRAHGYDRMDQIRYAVLESNGKISVIAKDSLSTPARSTTSQFESPNL